MASNGFSDKVSFIWSVADKLRGTYRPNQYRRIMLPVLSFLRFLLVLENAYIVRNDALDYAK
jgi:type I restriction enzyme M protein